MATFDYAELAADAKDMIAEFGRSVTFVKYSRSPADPNKPHRGPDQTANTELSVNAVEVNPKGSQGWGLVTEDELETLIREASVFYLVAGDDVAGDDLESYDSVKDGSAVYKIVRVPRLKPADTVLLYLVSARSVV